MDKKSRYLLVIFVVLFLASVGWKYYVFIIERDFIVRTTTPCDPTEEVCFADGTEDAGYYKKIEKNAKNITPCNPLENDVCPDLVCEPNEEDCTVLHCSEETLEAEETCTNPSEDV